MQAATPAANANPYGLIPALKQGGIIAISVFAVLVLMSIFSFYILFTKLMQQQKIIAQGRKVRASFWNSPNLREAATKLEAKSAYRAIVEERLNGVMVSVSGQLKLHYVDFAELVNPETLVTVVRQVPPDSDFHMLVRFLETYVNKESLRLGEQKT